MCCEFVIMGKLSVLLIIIVQQAWAIVSYEKPLCPPLVGSRCKDDGAPSHSELQYRIDGYQVTIKFLDGKYLEIPCPGSVTLDNDALPRFPRRISVQSVSLYNCPAPSSSIAVALSALNVTNFSKLTMNSLPPEPPLKKEHFADLKISWLELRARKKVTFEPDLLSNLNLIRLDMTYVSVEKLPIGLTVLRLDKSGLSPLPLEAIKSLHELQLSDVNRTDVSELANATELRLLRLRGQINELPVMPKLEELMLENWVPAEPRPWIHCAKLRSLTVTSFNVKHLPDDWLAACVNLQRLDLILPNLDGLSPHVLRGAVNLQQIFIRRSRLLKELPAELFESAKNLTVLDLSHNALDYLPSGIFSKSPNIQALNLSHNLLKASNMYTVATLVSLQNLTLSYNPLGSMCRTGTASVYTRATSDLSSLKDLRRLVMSRAEIPDLCDDWITWFPSLEVLDVRNNSITKLWYHNLMPRAATEIDLRGNNITNIVYGPDDCTAVVKGSAKTSLGIIKMDSQLICDCDLYMFAFARQKSPNHVTIHSLKCSNGEDLMNIDASDLYCDLSPPHDCVSGCTCELIPNSRPLTCHSQYGVRARCDAKALPNLYALQMDPLELTVTGLQDMSVLKLDGQLQKIDLKNNNISNASPEVSRMLMSRKRVVTLSGNPLNCACGERYLIEELLNHPNQVENFSETQCSDKRFLNELKRGECSRLPSGALAALAVLAAAAFAAMSLAGVLASPKLRMRFKIFLYKLGITLPCIRVNEEEEDKQYDAFISFSHHDGRLVMEEIVPMLEKDYRLCLHYRDWPIGGWIPEQIAISVRDSRRTIIVVSENYARSDWARAEFREAHAAAMRDAKPRLLAILLQEPPPELDPELKLYLSTNTYLKWSDPAFWDKLAYAMPRKSTKKLIPNAA